MSRLSRPYERAIEALHLPPMPGNLLRFHEEVLGDEPSLETLVGLALADPALSARLLCAASVPPFHRDGPLRGMAECLQALGMPMLRAIAGSLLAQAALPRGHGVPAAELAGFRRHALAVAQLARDLAHELGAQGVELEEAYLCGLLHDIGELLLLGGFGARYAAVLAQAGDERELAAREQELFATDHAAAGAWLVDQWALPSSMADAIGFHHLDADAAAGLDRLGRLLWSAHALLQRGEEDLAEAAGRLLGLAPARLHALAAQAAAVGAARAGDAADASPSDLPRPLPLPPAGAAAPAEPWLQAALAIPVALQSLPRDAATAGEAGLLHALAAAARILFGLRQPAFFLKAPDREVLALAPADAGPPALRRLQVPLHGTTSLCGDAARERRVLATHEIKPPARLPAIDRQIARALDAEGVVYVPMVARGVVTGVLALGVSPVQRRLLDGQDERLRQFAHAAARHLDGWRGLRERERHAQAEAAARFALEGQRLAHEVGNPLAIIRNTLNLLSADALHEAPGRADADLAVLREEIDRLGGIVRTFAAERPRPAAAAGPADLNVVLEGLRRVYGESLFDRAGLRLELRPSREPAWIAADADVVRQVVFNLWKNAAQAMGDSGSVVTEVEPRVDHNGARFAQLRIRDSGPGLPPSVRDALYQPLARAAEGAPRPGERAGLGLSIVLSLVQGMGGAITCVSRAGEGTTFAVLVPAP